MTKALNYNDLINLLDKYKPKSIPSEGEFCKINNLRPHSMQNRSQIIKLR